MMTTYRELKIEAVETIELDVHLEGCVSCRKELARSLFIGNQLRSLPEVEPSSDMHAKLMRSLAKEQLEFIRHSAPGTVRTQDYRCCPSFLDRSDWQKDVRDTGPNKTSKLIPF